MKINKYSVSKDGSTSIVYGAGQAVSNYTETSSTDNNYSSTASIDCILWGNEFTGEDLDGDINVEGDIFAKSFYEQNEDGSEFEVGGNIYADNLIQGKNLTITEKGLIPIIDSTQINVNEINSTQITTHTINSYEVDAISIFFNYPENDSKQMNLRVLLNQFDYVLQECQESVKKLNERMEKAEADIQQNEEYIHEVDHKRLDMLDDIKNLQQEVSELKDKITLVDNLRLDLQEQVDLQVYMIEDNRTNIIELQERISNLENANN